MNVVEKSVGTHIAYDTTKTSIIFGDEDLIINLKNRERDNDVTIDICLDTDGELTMGVAAGMKYAAQIEIPARQYTETTEENPDYNPDDEMSRETITTREPVAFDIDNCTLYLYAID